MKCYLRNFIIFLFLFVSCKKSETKDFTATTWKICNKKGVYSEITFTDNYVFILHSDLNKVLLFKKKTKKNQIILSQYENGIGLPNNSDTITTLFQTRTRISLKFEFSKEILIMDKATSDIIEVDSLNLKKWKKNTLIEFNKRAQMENCHDLRTESEKIIHQLDDVNINYLEEEI